jgi:hypothetical protein
VRSAVQASVVYPISEEFQVHSHQFWAACALWQATQNEDHFKTARELYKEKIRVPEGVITQLYDPVANYINPTWYGMLCMAQSAPKFSGLEEEATLNVGNSTENPEDFADEIFKQPFQNGTRGEAMQQIWKQFVYPWISYEQNVVEEKDRRIKCDLAALAPSTYAYSSGAALFEAVGFVRFTQCGCVPNYSVHTQLLDPRDLACATCAGPQPRTTSVGSTPMAWIQMILWPQEACVACFVTPPTQLWWL